MRAVRSTVRGAMSVVVATAATLGCVGTAAALPPPPPNPSDSAIHGGKQHVHQKATEVGKITSKLASAQSRLDDLQNEVELKRELAKKAQVDAADAQGAAARAERKAYAAKKQAHAASAAIARAQRRLDRFASLSYQQGSTVGSVTAFVGSNSPKEVLRRDALLNAVGAAKLHTLDALQRARTRKANLDSSARAALEKAKQKKAAAEQAEKAAQAARGAAIDAAQDQQAKTSSIHRTQHDLQEQLDTAQAHLGDLTSARHKYRQWHKRKEAEEAAEARAAAAARRKQSKQRHEDAGDSAPPASHQQGSVQAVIDRARSALGITYAWGGGNSHGPTAGIHDGGVADAHHDYAKVGFDCSGLMTYAFAAAGVSLPSYSGYQYTAGTHVPVSAKHPGDMLFWSTNGAVSGIHHVALYIGNGEMIEAPHSGAVVHISPVRHSGLMPYAVRLL